MTNQPNPATHPPQHQKKARRAYRAVCAVITGVLALCVAITAAPAFAGTAAHGYGYTWASDGASFIGSYRVNGLLAYCDNVAALPATNFGYGSPDWTPNTGWSSADKARLAYLMREYGASRNNTTAAAVGLNIWRITGMNGHTDAYYAARAGGKSAAVLAAANTQRTAMNKSATTAVRASATVTFAHDASTGTVSTTLQVDKLSGWSTVASGAFTGTLKLSGAVFSDTGSATRSVGNGRSYPITATVVGGKYSVDASVSYARLPYGDTIGVMSSTTSGRQPLLVADHRDVTASAAAATTAGVVPIPFAVTVLTHSSAQKVLPGAPLTDTLDVAVAATAANPGAQWPTAGADPAAVPVPVTIRSRLWGPFDVSPTEAAAPPADARPVCEVTRVVTAPGTVTSGTCTPMRPGFYTWTASVDPNDTSVADGRSQVIGMQSRFGEAAETTLVPWQPEAKTVVSEKSVTTGTCVFDAITVTGMPPGGEADVVSEAWGPFSTAPAAGTHIDSTTARPATTSTVHVSSDGTVRTPCRPLGAPGYYVYTYRSARSATVAAFSSTEVFSSETVSVRPPGTALAFTGASSGSAQLGAAGLILAGFGALIAAAAWRGRRRTSPAGRRSGGRAGRRRL